jgi:diacylglycerol kinase
MKKFLKSFSHTLYGLQHALVHEQNFRIELFCAIAVCGCGYLFKIAKIEWFIVIINIAAVLTAELFNTALENLCDIVQKEIDPTIKIVKDVSAAAVVITALCAFICGCIIFIPIIKLIITS